VRSTCLTSFVVTAIIFLTGLAENGQAQESEMSRPTEVTYREMIIGDVNAPVTIVEYASLTCNHCAAFHEYVLPELKKNYIDTGKVRLVFRDFPLDGLAMAGAMLARCAPGQRGQRLLDVMFKNQMTWMRSTKPIEPLTSYARLAGMTEADVEACLENEEIITAIRQRQQTAQAQYKINATPTFFIETERIEGNQGYEVMAEIIDDIIQDGR